MKTTKTIKEYVKAFRKAQEAKKAAEAEMKKATEWLLTNGNVVDVFDDIDEVKEIFAEDDVTYVAATKKLTLDSARLKKEAPEAYKKFLKVSTTKHYIK